MTDIKQQIVEAADKLNDIFGMRDASPRTVVVGPVVDEELQRICALLRKVAPQSARITELESEVERLRGREIPEAELEVGAVYECRPLHEVRLRMVWRGGERLQWQDANNPPLISPRYDKSMCRPLRKLTPPPAPQAE